MKSTVAPFWLFLFLYLGFNIASGQEVPDSTRIDIDIALTGSYQSGNFKRLQLINKLDASFDSKNRKWNFLTRHLYLYQTVFGNKSQDDYLGRNFLTHRVSEKFDVFSALFLEQYFIKRIDLHTQYGIGARYAFIKKPRTFVQFGLMGSYSNKKYVAANFLDFDNNGSNTIDAFFVSPILNTKFIIIPKRLVFNFLFWFQQDISESKNWRFDIESAMIAPLYKGLSLKLSVNNFYENINLEGVQANDLFLTYGLTYAIVK